MNTWLLSAKSSPCDTCAPPTITFARNPYSISGHESIDSSEHQDEVDVYHQRTPPRTPTAKRRKNPTMPEDIAEQFRSFADQHNYYRRLRGAETHWFFVEAKKALRHGSHIAAILPFINGIEASRTTKQSVLRLLTIAASERKPPHVRVPRLSWGG